MQFGQGYEFSNSRIIKNNNNYEPRLVVNYDKTKYYLQRYSNTNERESFLKNIQEDFAKMVKSISKYKGFYIGRYETGDEIVHDSSKISFIKPQIVRYNQNLRNITWYGSYDEIKRLVKNKEKYVTVGMIYDCLWEYTLKWLNETDTISYEDILENAAIWGNYKNNSLTYKEEVNGNILMKSFNVSKLTPTGSIETITYKGEVYRNLPTSSNNIFDLAGNVAELTIATAYASSRRTRGGTYGSLTTTYYGMPGRYNDSPPNYTNDGFRSLLCIN